MWCTKYLCYRNLTRNLAESGRKSLELFFFFISVCVTIALLREKRHLRRKHLPNAESERQSASRQMCFEPF